MENRSAHLELQTFKKQVELDVEVRGGSAALNKIKQSIEDEIKSLNNRNRPVIFAKIAVVFIVFLLSFLHTRSFASSRKSVDCIKDNVLEISESMNQKLNDDPALLKFLQITSSTVVDFADISVLAAYNLRGVTLAYPLQVFLFYVLRGVIQGIFLFKHPKGTVWTDPGVPSLTVPYGIMCDYYFSGHCGFVTMMALENYKLGNPKNALALAVLLPYLAFVLVTARVHYSIDIPIGVMFGIYCHYWAHTYVDNFHWLMRSTFNRHVWQKIPYFSEV